MILGSASPVLVRAAAVEYNRYESLAGRLETIAVSGFSLAEVGEASIKRYWLRGGLPSPNWALHEKGMRSMKPPKRSNQM
jgi:hypothetical protein